MTTITFDTLELAKELKTAGFTEPQAEAVARAFKRSHDIDHIGDATRVDIATAKGESVAVRDRLNDLERKLGETELRLKGDLRELELRMIIKLGVMLLAMSGIIVAALKYFIVP
jgi:hypothetical protein